MKKSLRLALLFLTTFLVFENSYSQNDLCSNAIVLTPAIDISWYGNSTTGTFVGATIGSPAPTCATNSSQDVWYKFVATATLMTVSLQSYNQNYGVQVFENNCSGPIMGCINLQSNQTDDFGSNNFIVGNTYYVRVFNSTISNPSDFDFEISVLQPPPPANDLCENALIEEPCGGTCAPFYGTFHGATISAAGLGCAPNASQDVWVKFRADHASNLITAFPTAYSGLDIALEIHEGSCDGPIIACVNDKIGDSAEQYRETNFVINQTYYIRVLNSSNTISTSTFALTVWYDYFPPNDLPSNAELITPNPSECKTGTFYRTSFGSTPVSCVPNTYLDVWYKFVPTTSGMTLFIEPVDGVNIGMQIFDGSANGNAIACVNSNYIGSGEIFTYANYIVGQTYLIRVLNLGGVQSAAFQICITNNLPPVNDLCPTAIMLTPSTNCTTTTKGFFNFSTISSTAPSCGIDASQDVWYRFNATSTTMSVILSQAGSIDIGFQIFQGNCNGSIMGCINTEFNVFQSYNYGEITLNNFVVGQTYFVRVFNANAIPVPSTFHICVIEYATPINDSCSNAATLTPSVTCGEYTYGELNGSTISSSAPTCTTAALGDVWYQFVATTPIAIISLYSYVTDFALGYEVFHNSCSGTSIFCSTTTIDGTLPILTIGQTYYVRVFNTNTTITSYSSFNICIVSYPPPVNNICNNAISITPNVLCESVSGTLSGATLNGPITSCAPTANQDLWYKFVAVTPAMTVSLYLNGWGTEIDQSLEIYSGDCTGEAIACANVSSSSTSEEISYSNFTVGQTYYIRVLAANPNFFAYGFYVCVTYIAPPSNDSCENALPIIPSSTWSSQYGTLHNSSFTGAIPSCTSNASQDVWYSFVATNPLLKINLEAYNTIDFGLQVFQGSCDGNVLGCAVYNPQVGFDGFTYNNYIVGQTYLIRVFNTTSLASNFGFNICIIDYPAPSNDLCDTATLLTVSNSCATTTGSFNGATFNNVSSCTSGANQDVWYQFVASNPSMSIVLAVNNEIDLGMEIKSGSCTGTSLGCINENPNNFAEKFTQNNFTVGETYFVRVFHLNSVAPISSFEIFVQEFSSPTNDSSLSATSLASSETCNSIVGTFSGSSLCSLPSYCNEGALQDVWYQFIASSPLAQIMVSPTSELDLGVEVYNNLGPWTYPIQCNNSVTAGAGEQCIMTEVTVGQKYWIRILNVNNDLSSSSFEICVQEYQIPTNDLCGNAAALTANIIPTEMNGTLNSATITDSIPTCTTNNYASCDVWYTFIATGNTMTVSMPLTENLYAGLAIYENGCASNELGCKNYQNIQVSAELTLNNYTVGETYFIRVFGESGFPITPSFKVFVTSPSLGLEEYGFDKITLFPNPTRDVLNLELPDTQNLEIIQCNITNMLGQNVYYTTTNYQKVDVSAFAKGVYQVLIKTNKGTWTGKFIKD